MHNNNRKRDYGGVNIQEKNKLMNDLYWREVNIFKRRLDEKYDNFKRTPDSHKEHLYYSKQFMKHYKNSGKRWMSYWEEKLDEKFEKELKEAKTRIWKETQQKYELRKPQDEGRRMYKGIDGNSKRSKSSDREK
jgi:hypothetical protein